MKIWRDVSRSNCLFHQHVNGQSILGMHHGHHSGVGTHLQRSQNLTIIGIQTTWVRHEELDGGNTFAFNQ